MEQERPSTSRTLINEEPIRPSPSPFEYPVHSIPSTFFPHEKAKLSDLERGERGDASPRSLWSYFMEDVEPSWCTGPLTAFCFMSGFIDAISFSAMFIWCGPQTGNTIQLALALARLFEGPPSLRNLSFRKSDQLALCSLIAFNFGILLGRFGDRVGAISRIWMMMATFLQALFTMVAAIAVWKSGQPTIISTRGDPMNWADVLTFVGLAFMSMSLGLQGVQGKRLDTHFGTTIPLTTIWVELVSDRSLFNLRQRIVSRDHKTLTIVACFLGAFCSRALASKLGAAGTLGIAVGLRLLVAISWIFIPRKDNYSMS